MLFRTHLSFGVLIGLLFYYFNRNILFSFVIVIFSFFPDIDYYKSKIGKKTFPISLILNLFFGHRGLFHSLIFPIIFLILYFLNNNSIFLVLFIGYISHLFLDSFSKEGIKILPFFPFRINFGFKVGGLFEWIIFFGLVLMDMLIVFLIIR